MKFINIKSILVILMFATILISSIQAKRGGKRNKLLIDTQTSDPTLAHQLFPQGRDDHEDILQDKVFLLETRPSSQTPQENFIRRLIKLNRNAVYYTSKEDTYRGIKGSIQLIDLFTDKTDDAKSYKCCSKVSPVNKKFIQINNTQSQNIYYCVKLSASLEQWDVCFFRNQAAHDWLKQLKQNVIRLALENQGIYDVQFVKQTAPKIVVYSWLEQTKWPGSCQDGIQQSPAQIESKTALRQPNFRLVFDFKKPDLAPVVQFDGQQNSVLGKFGEFVYQQAEVQRTFVVEKIQFKFPSEHLLNGKQHDGEMLVIGRKKGGDEYGIMSFLIESSDDAENSKFIDQLNYNSWSLSKKLIGKNQTLKNEQIPNIEDLVHGGLTHKFRKSFFAYKGSFSDPPCQEGVYRFLLSTIITIGTQQLENLKKHTFLVDKETNGNARTARVLDASRIVYYHADKSDGCEETVEKILEEKKPVEEKDKCADAKPNGKFVQAKSDVSTFAVTDQTDFVTGQFGDNLKIEEIAPSKIPDNVLEDIEQKAQILDQQNCKAKNVRKQAEKERQQLAQQQQAEEKQKLDQQALQKLQDERLKAATGQK